MLAPKLLCRALHSAVPRETVEMAISSCIQSGEKTRIEYIKFGKDPELDTKIIMTASKAAHIPVPDNILASLKNCRDLIKYLCEPREPPVVKGIPKFELFSGEDLPLNVTLINYRKKRWSVNESTTFVRTSLHKSKLLSASYHSKAF